jgi:sensor histidine kinase regulating citrate/malate metabolism
MVTDTEGKIKFLNPAFSEMFDVEQDTALEKRISEVFPAPRILHVMRTRKAEKATRCAFDGRDALINRYPIISNGEVIGGLIEVYFRDINMLKDLMQRLNSNSRNHPELASLEEGIGFEWGQEHGLEEQRGGYAPYSGNSAPWPDLQGKQMS